MVNAGHRAILRIQNQRGISAYVGGFRSRPRPTRRGRRPIGTRCSCTDRRAAGSHRAHRPDRTRSAITGRALRRGMLARRPGAGGGAGLAARTGIRSLEPARRGRRRLATRDRWRTHSRCVHGQPERVHACVRLTGGRRRLRHRVALQSPSNARGARGQVGNERTHRRRAEALWSTGRVQLSPGPLHPGRCEFPPGRRQRPGRGRRPVEDRGRATIVARSTRRDRRHYRRRHHSPRSQAIDLRQRRGCPADRLRVRSGPAERVGYGHRSL